MTTPKVSRRAAKDKLPNYWAFPAASTAQIKEQLDEAGADAVLRIYPNGEGVRAKVASASYDGPFIDDSYSCPPRCP